MICAVWAVGVISLPRDVWGADPNANDTNDVVVVQLGSEAKNINYLAEAVYWPTIDYKNVARHLSEPNAQAKGRFVKLLTAVMEPNHLPPDLPSKLRFAKGWRGKGRENFVVQYLGQEYLIRVKSQVTTINRDKSFWTTLLIQRKDMEICVAKDQQQEIFRFCDQFLSKHVNSEAQNYAGIKNMPGPVFRKLDTGYFLAYAVQASKPNIDVVCIWTDGKTVIINLKERRKAFRAVEKKN
jgi:hypothetical protein